MTGPRTSDAQRYTFQLDANTTVTGWIKEVPIAQGRTGVQLVKMEQASNGRAVDVSTIIGEPFADIEDLAINVVLVYRGRPADLMDMTLISAAAYDKWGQIGRAAIEALLDTKQLRPEDIDSIPDAQAELLPSGDLRFYTTVAGQTVEMTIPSSDWSWR